MLGILIKNNLKLMIRNKFIIILMLLGPVLVTAALSSAFSSLMSKYDLSTDLTVGYTSSNTSDLTFMEQIKDTANENGIEFKRFDTNDYSSALNSEHFDVYVVFEDGSYTLYQEKDHRMESDTVGYLLSTVYHTAAYQPVVSADQTQTPVSRSVHYQRETVPKIPTPDSTNYYGIIEIVYFLWCGISALAAVISSERKNHIQTRFNLSAMSKFQLFLGKAIPCTLAVFLETMLSAIICVFLFHVHWGNLIGSALILLLGSIAATCLGIFLFYLFRNTVIPVICIFVLTWIYGFLGGTFETYMFSIYPETVKRCSPIYFMNRTLVEYSTTGSSSFTIPTIVYLCIFSVICAIAGILLMNKRMEEK